MGLWSWIVGDQGKTTEPPTKQVVQRVIATTPPPTVPTLAAKLLAEFPDGVPSSEVKKSARSAGLDVDEVNLELDRLEAREVRSVTIDSERLHVVDLPSLETARHRIVGQSYWVTDYERRRLGGREFLLIREPDNRVDPLAIAVYRKGRKVGYLSASRAGMLSPLLDRVQADAFRVTGIGATATTLKMLVDLPSVPTLRQFVASLDA